MYLTQFNSVPEAAEWLNEHTQEQWSWKDVLRIFSEIDTDAVSVNIPASAPRYRISMTGVEECKFDNIERFEVQNSADFLHHILMGDSFDTAYAKPQSIILGSVRYRIEEAIPASSIRLTKHEVYQIAEYSPLESFPALVKQLRAGEFPDLAKLVQGAAPTVDTPAERRSRIDITRERGTRRRILELWNEIEKQHGKDADGHQVLRKLKLDKDAKPPELKTVQNRLIELRNERLIP